MKSFTGRSIAFIIILVAVFGSTEWFVESRPNAAKYKHYWLAAHAEEVGTLVLGSSHTFYGIDAKAFYHGKKDKGFNLAMVSQTCRYDRYLLTHYDFSNLHTLILPYSYFTLYEDFESMPDERYMAIRYRAYMGCDLHRRLSEYGLEVMSSKSVKQRIKLFCEKNECYWDSCGTGANYTYNTRPTPWDDGIITASNNTYYPDTSLVALNKEFLTDIMQMCKDRHIDMFLITTPVSPTFKNHQSKQQDSINTSVLKALLKAYPEVHYHDFTEDKRFADRDFYDSHHLNTDGQEKLTCIINNLIQKESTHYR